MSIARIVKKSVGVFVLLFATSVYADSILSPVTDTVNAGIINAKIAMDSSLSNADVNAHVNRGIVILTGTVNTREEEKQLIQISQSISGIRGVDVSGLKVKDTNHPLTDSEITAAVKTLFIKEKIFGDLAVPVITIHVATMNGNVALDGTATSQDQLNNAIALAKSVKGVKSVESKVVIQQ